MSFWLLLLFSSSSLSSVWNVVESTDERSVDDVITVVAAKRKFFNFGGESIVSKSIADCSNIYFKSLNSLVGDDDWFIKSRNNERTLFKWSL